VYTEKLRVTIAHVVESRELGYMFGGADEGG
jgi:hypothetical protein